MTKQTQQNINDAGHTSAQTRRTNRAWPVAGRLPQVVLSVILVGLLLNSTSLQAQDNATHSQTYNIGADTLDAVISNYISAAGVSLATNATLTAGKRSPGLRGTYSIEEGFARILDGQGLQAVRQANGVWSLQAIRGSNGQNVANLAPVLVRATVDPVQQVYETPAAVDVVTREQIDALPPRNASDILAEVPGVYTVNDRQSPALVINIRGMQDYGRVNVTLDGARQNFQKSGHGNNGEAYIDPELLAQVDIIKGTVQGVGGAGTIAGMVNFRTLEASDVLADDASFGGRLNATTGSNAYDFSGSLALALRPSDKLDFLAAYSHKKVGAFDIGTHGDTINEFQYGIENRLSTTTTYTSQKQNSGLFKATLRPAIGHEIKLGYVGFRSDFDTGANPIANCDDADGCSSSGAANKVLVDTLTAGYTWNRDNWLNLAAKAYYNQTEYDSTPFTRISYSGGDTVDPDASSYLDYLEFGSEETHYETRTVGASLANTSYFSLSGVDAALSYGGEIAYDRTRTKSNYGDVNDPALGLGTTPSGNRSVGGVFANLQLKHAGWLELNAGLRRDFWRLRGGGNMYLGFNDNDYSSTVSDVYLPVNLARHGARLLPSLSVAAQVAEPLQLFANWGKGLRPPAVTESLMSGSHQGGLSFPMLPNPYLEPEKSVTWEIGANLIRERLLSSQDQLRIKAVWFNTRVENYIMNGRVLAPNDAAEFTALTLQRYGYVNLIDPVRFKGLEFKLDYDAGIAFGSFNYTRTLSDMASGRYNPLPYGTNRDNPVTRYAGTSQGLMFFQLPPRDKFSLSLGLRLLERKLTLGARAVHSSGNPRAPGDFGIIEELGGAWKAYTVYDAWAAYQWNKHVTLRLAVENIRDQRYAEPMGSSINIAPGRTVLVSTNIRF